MDEIRQLVAGLEHFVHAFGAPAVLVIVALEAFGTPLPGETLLIFSAIMAARGEMSLPALWTCAFVGAVVGDNIGYLLGRTLGRAAITRFGAKIGLTESRFRSIEGVFARYGAATVAFARFFDVLRQLNGVVAGTLGMDWRRFLVCNALGGALWVSVWVLGTFYLSRHASVFVGAAHHLGLVGMLITATAGVALLIGALWWLRGGSGQNGRLPL